MLNTKFDASLFLRIGLAFSFLYAGIDGLLNPESWIGYIPSFVEIVISRYSFLTISYAVNILIGLWLISGKKTFYAAIVAAVALAGIVLTNLNAFLIVFRDIGLFFAAVALAVLTRKR